MAEIQSWAPLSRRDAGLPTDDTLYDEVPSHLAGPLGSWAQRFDEALRRSLAHGTDDGGRAVEKWWTGLLLRLRMEENTFENRPASDQLDLIDAILRWCPASDTGLLRHIDALDELLLLGGSAWCVRSSLDGLERRLDPTVTMAARTAVEASAGDAGQHLAAAWIAAYGRHPDPDKVMNESIRAIEAVACPLVEPARATRGKATLGTVIGELRNSGHRWELALPGPEGAPADVSAVVAMLGLLWQSQLSRHAGAPKSRRQEQPEAEAAVHLAAALVHWLQSGVLRRKAP
ncbi:hypothetical protein [Actinoplanes sp. NBRC 103695]|uniref:hypothetical protein n=1 Tax=Actinoplanes sp. NBRC 103695 TaxID=3032202 RepID=UPI0024A075E0|nr:hypothetical protein [Actinoplanes sp. NBRC 103695]GLY96571.1 hypothetical protein Acsp02_38260 [Actinoplanes sp. NBRC 103695]